MEDRTRDIRSSGTKGARAVPQGVQPADEDWGPLLPQEETACAVLKSRIETVRRKDVYIRCLIMNILVEAGEEVVEPRMAGHLSVKARCPCGL